MTPSDLKAAPYKLLIIVGPTSSGKSELAVRLAKRFNGEIISADSRQIYKGMDLGTGKIEGRWISYKPNKSNESYTNYLAYVYKTVPHHLIDIVNPRRQYSAAIFQRKAKKIIADITKRGKLPILCGGTMHWIDAVAYGQHLPDVKPNLKLRAKLEKISTPGLFARISRLDPVRAKNIDRHNRRRLIRALEIILTTGKPVPPRSVILSEPGGLEGESKNSLNQVLWLGIKIPQADLYKKIDKRLKQRLKAGMIEEVRNLHSATFKAGLPKRQGRVRGGYDLSWKRLEQFGLEYRFISQYLQNKISYDAMVSQLSFAIKHYSKRQITWWKRNKNIKWISNPAKPPIQEIKKWLNK